MKKCSKCGIEKELTDFSPSKSCTGGRRGKCKKCASAFAIEWQTNRNSTLYGKMKSIMTICRHRAKEKGVEFNLDHDFLMALYIKQNGQCALSGLNFRIDNIPYLRISPYHPSIDRIKPSLGYTKKNVHFILLSLNIAKAEWDLSYLIPIWKAAVKQNRSKN